jgi:hypothetical protein
MAELETVPGISDDEGDTPKVQVPMNSGVRLARKIADHWLMKTIFPDIKDKKK